MWGFTFPKTSVAKGSEIRGFALFVILGPDVMKVPFNKKIDTTFKRLQYHVVQGMLNVFTGVSDILHNGIIREWRKIVQ